MPLPPEYATKADVRGLNGFPEVDDPKLESWIAMKAGEINTILRTKGVTVPVVAPEDFAELLRQAVVFGAASMVESAPRKGQKAADYAQSVAVYREEYNRLVAYLNSLTRDALIAIGLLAPPAPSSVPGIPGLVLAGNNAVDQAATHWSYAYPFRLRKPGDPV